MGLLIDATTAEHARGIRTAIDGILSGLAEIAPEDLVIVAGESGRRFEQLEIRRNKLVGSVAGRLLYQRILLPVDVELVSRRKLRIDRVLLLDSYCPLLRPQSRVRYSALVHDLLPVTHPQFWPASKRWVKRTAFSSLRRAGATVYTSSEHNATLLRDVLGLQTHVIRFGCGQLQDWEADAALTSPLPRREPYLLYVGAFERRKNLAFLLEAFEYAAGHLGSDFRLVLAGGGDRAYAGRLADRIAKSHLRERISVRPSPTRTAVLDLIAHAGVLVFPSLAEGFGLPILEALALGTPVVASDIPEVRSWALGAVQYAPLDEPSEWSLPLKAAVEATEDRRREGQQFALRYRWRGCARGLLEGMTRAA